MPKDLLADQPIAHKLISKGFWIYAFTFILAPVGYFTKLLISNNLSVEEVGVLYSIVSLIAMLDTYNDLGLTQTLAYFIPQDRINKRYNAIFTNISISAIVQVTSSVIIFSLLWHFSDRLGVSYFKNPDAARVLRAMACTLLTRSVFFLINGIYTAFQDTFSGNLVGFMDSVILFGLTSLFFMYGQPSLHLFTIARVSATGVALLTTIIIFARKYSSILKLWHRERNKTEFQKYFRYSLRIFLSWNAWMLLRNLNQQMIVAIAWPLQAWYFSTYLSLQTIPTIIITPLFSIFMPLISEILARKQHEKYKTFINFLYTYFSVFALSFTGLFFTLWPVIATALFGAKFIPSGNMMSYNSLFFLFMVMYPMSFNILQGIGQARKTLFILLSALAVNIPLNLFLIPHFGAAGASLTMTSDRIIMTIISITLVYRYQAILPNRKFIIRNVILIIILGGGVRSLQSHLFVLNDTSRYADLGILIGVWLLYYGIIALYNLPAIRSIIAEVKQMRSLPTPAPVNEHTVE